MASGVAPPRADADIREWLADHPRAASPYTRTRVGESYDHIDGILERFGEVDRGSALDIGCGNGFDTFALAANFNRVEALDASWRRLMSARLLARRAGVRRIRFHRAKAEDFDAPGPFDFVYCNIMSELVSSRRLLAERIASLTGPGACVYYAEETDGYAPMEIARAIENRDVAELTHRLHQLVNGFAGIPLFRFYLSGTAGELFSQYGFETVASQQKSWRGLVYEDAVWLRRVAGERPPTGSDESDYARLSAEFADMRTQLRTALRGGRIDPAKVVGSRFSVFVPLLTMAWDVLGSRVGKQISAAGRVRLRARLVRSPDWSRLEAGTAEFLAVLGNLSK